LDYFVCTFHKCGSTWFRRLYRAVAELNGLNIKVNKPSESTLNKDVYIGSDNTLFLFRNPNHKEIIRKTDGISPVLLCIRDPKDVVISQYWSWKESHNNNTPHILQARNVLNELDVKKGIRYLLEKESFPYLRVLDGWAPLMYSSQVGIIRYENLLNNFNKEFQQSINFLKLSITNNDIEILRTKYSFSKIAKREAGMEDTSSHFRKGVAGDWKNYFDGALSTLFDDRYGMLCDRIGYARATDSAAVKP